MVTPVVEVRIDWRTTLGETPVVSNGGFEVDTSGWSAAAGLFNEAATSITRDLTQKYAGVASAAVVVGSVNDGVNYAFGNTIFLAGVTYRVSFAVLTTPNGVIASFGTAADFAFTAPILPAAGWQFSTLQWTPSADRQGVEFAVVFNASTSGTFYIDAVSVEVVGSLTADASPFNAITNDGFETNTTGWSVSAGINAAGTSITRDTTAPLFAGTAHGRLVTTGTNGSGTNWDFGTRPFISGRTYRFRVPLRSVSGTTSAKLAFGSEGTGADRATTTMTLTTSWVYYSVDWTPSATRIDAQAVVQNGAAAIMTADIDDAGAFEALEDASGDVMSLTYGRSVSLDGSGAAPGTLSMTLRNDDQRYDPESTTSVLTGMLTMGRAVWLRATYGGVLYPLWYGIIRRVVPRPKERTVQILCEDPLYHFGREETSVVVSTVRTVSAFRGLILDDIGEAAARRSLSTGSAEVAVPYTGADQVLAKGRLDDLNRATGTIHYIKPNTSSAVLYQYVTKERMELATAASTETWDAINTGITDVDSYDLTDEALINSQRVAPTLRTLQGSTTIWTMAANELPFTVSANTTQTVWASYSAPASSQAHAITVTNAPTVTFTGLSESGKVVITAGASDAVVSALSVTGSLLTANPTQSVLGFDQSSVDKYDGEYKGSDIATNYLASRTEAQGLADYLVSRYKDPQARPSVQVKNVFPTQVVREIGDRVTLTADRLSVVSQESVIRGFSTTIVPGALWDSSYALEEYIRGFYWVWDVSRWDVDKWAF